MSDYLKLKEELEAKKAEFMKLETSEQQLQYRNIMQEFVNSKTPEEKELLGKAFLEGAKEACQRAEKLYDEVLRNYLEEIYDTVSWSYIARHYFGKSRSWLSQRINAMKVGGKIVQFTENEKKTLINALQDLSKRYKDTAQVLEHL